MAERQPRWGYKGTETAANGLRNWLQEKLPIRGTVHERFDEYNKIIVRYAVVNIPNFKKRGHAVFMADFISKKIDKNKKFQHFAEWVLKNELVHYNNVKQ